MTGPPDHYEQLCEWLRAVYGYTGPDNPRPPAPQWVAVSPSSEDGLWTVWTGGLEQNYRVCLTAPDSLYGERLAREIVALHEWGRKQLSDGR